jgi:hypothetical protein
MPPRVVTARRFVRPPRAVAALGITADPFDPRVAYRTEVRVVPVAVEEVPDAALTDPRTHSEQSTGSGLVSLLVRSDERVATARTSR